MMDIKSFFEQYKFYAAGILIGLAIIVYFAVTSFAAPEETFSFEPSADEELPAEESKEETAVLSSTLFVEVKGAVKLPGVYELPIDARVKNVLDITGLTDKADLATVNQSAKLADEMVIYVPFEGETEETTADLFSGSGVSDAGSERELVNINTAGIAELTTLNGIGEKKAQAIITYREEQGLFSTLEDLKNIPGIGDKTFENLKPYITIN
ncbi:ComEA family DNA-binding protein [Jeotgalicoccus halotolerans]|nr:ComEA family DNA-binding protein [Jeotgalicoccus halotolerans]